MEASPPCPKASLLLDCMPERRELRTVLALRKLGIPGAYAMCPRSPCARSFAAEPAIVPFWRVMADQREFRSEYPPFAFKPQIAARHLGKRNVSAPVDLAHVLV